MVCLGKFSVSALKYDHERVCNLIDLIFFGGGGHVCPTPILKGLTLWNLAWKYLICCGVEVGGRIKHFPFQYLKGCTKLEPQHIGLS